MQPRERINLQPAFVLHSREYRDTSRILDVFTVNHGRLTLFARGARGQVEARLAAHAISPPAGVVERAR